MTWKNRELFVFCRNVYVLDPSYHKKVNQEAVEPIQFLSFCFMMRSEERRVGKECRSLCDWSSDVCSSDLTECDSLAIIFINSTLIIEMQENLIRNDMEEQRTVCVL